MKPDLVLLAKKFFSLDLPTTQSQLKSAFRRESRKLHPDYETGSEEVFKRMKQAYDELCKTDYVFKSEAETDTPMTVDGLLLSTLGIGVSNSKNGIACDHCEGKGYTSIASTDFRFCSLCNGSGFVIKCPLCKGRGYTVPLPGRCHRCIGKGWLSLTSARGISPIPLCPSCQGSGGFKRSKPEYKHYKCGDCDGKGEREMFNPLLPKGRMQR